MTAFYIYFRIDDVCRDGVLVYECIPEEGNRAVYTSSKRNGKPLIHAYIYLLLLFGKFSRWQTQYIFFFFRLWYFIRIISITKTSLFKYIGKFTSKIWKYLDKNSNIFLISAQKHRLWVLFRTASPRRF